MMAPSRQTTKSEIGNFKGDTVTEEHKILKEKSGHFSVNNITDYKNEEKDDYECKSILHRLKKNQEIVRCNETENLDGSKTFSFLPYDFGDQIQDLNTAVFIQLQIVAENILENIVKVTQISMGSEIVFADVLKIFEENNVKANFAWQQMLVMDENVVASTDLLVGENLFRDKEKIVAFSNILHENAFIITLEDKLCDLFRTDTFNIVSKIPIKGRTLALLKKASSSDYENVSFIQTSLDEHYTWFANMQRDLKRNKKVILVSERETQNWLREFVKEMQKIFKNQIGLFEVNDYQVPPFDPENNFFKRQLQKTLTLNVLNKGRWGGYYYLPIIKNLSVNDAATTS